MAGPIGSAGKTENEKLYVVKRIGHSWTNAKILDTVFDAFPMHWQFPLIQKEICISEGIERAPRNVQTYGLLDMKITSTVHQSGCPKPLTQRTVSFPLVLLLTKVTSFLIELCLNLESHP